ncbi:MAG: RsbRD N-terminal domain-containing protein [Deltaproteobacteria bacterium]|nr:RsbRD N-terminal domain-containing protein [Deltaproteobacteria bacterium]
MQIATLLSQKKAAILGRWLSMIYESYPPETAIFLRKEKNRFDNPAGYRISEGLEGLYGTLLQEMERDQVMACLDEIIRIRALQNFTPSQALAFIFLLKIVIRQELAEEIQKENLAAEILDLESRIDGLALLGFDVYTKRREKIYEIKANEAKRRVSGLMRKTGLTEDGLL